MISNGIIPGGALGHRLASKIKDIMLVPKALFFVSEGTPMTDAVVAVDRGGLGTVLVTNPSGKLSGIITDGDIRRMVVSGRPIADLAVEDVMTKNPRTQEQNAPTYDALYIMEQHQITVLPIVNSGGEVKGILHLHDILGKGEFKFNGG